MKKTPKRVVKILFVLFGLSILFLLYCHLESRWLKEENVELISKDVPESFSGKKIVFITDIHHGPFFSIERVQQLVDRINKLEPDLILLGGDYVHRDSSFIRPLFDEFQHLSARYGIYGVLGNHDHWEDADLTSEMMKRNGINICDNASYWLKIEKDSIKIGGVGDLWEDTQILENTTADLAQSDFSILISHSPDYLETLHTDLIDFTLSGHTHGGQMTFFGLWAPVLPSKYGQKYRYGLKQFEHMQSYISSGVGTITPPIRFFCRPEIVVIELKKE